PSSKSGPNWRLVGATGAAGRVVCGPTAADRPIEKRGSGRPVPSCHGFRNSSGSLAIFAAIRRASSLRLEQSISGGVFSKDEQGARQGGTQDVTQFQYCRAPASYR